jgi:hypothetical protein
MFRILIIGPGCEAEKLLKQAEECRRQAAKALNDHYKEEWLRMADEWIRLAQSIEST